MKFAPLALLAVLATVSASLPVSAQSQAVKERNRTMSEYVTGGNPAGGDTASARNSTAKDSAADQAAAEAKARTNALLTAPASVNPNIR